MNLTNEEFEKAGGADRQKFKATRAAAPTVRRRRWRLPIDGIRSRRQRSTRPPAAKEEERV